MKSGYMFGEGGELGPEFSESEIERIEEERFRLGVAPFSDEELESLLLEKVIIPEFGPPKETPLRP